MPTPKYTIGAIVRFRFQTYTVVGICTWRDHVSYWLDDSIDGLGVLLVREERCHPV